MVHTCVFEPLARMHCVLAAAAFPLPAAQLSLYSHPSVICCTTAAGGREVRNGCILASRDARGVGGCAAAGIEERGGPNDERLAHASPEERLAGNLGFSGRRPIEAGGQATAR